jgi:hypothetical protein
MSEAQPTSAKANELSEVAFWARFWSIIALVAWLVVVGDLIRLAYQWLRYGSSEKVVLAQFLPTPAVDWVGIQRVIDFVWTTQISILAVVVLFVSGWLYGDFAKHRDRLRDKARYNPGQST